MVEGIVPEVLVLDVFGAAVVSWDADPPLGADEAQPMPVERAKNKIFNSG